VLDPDDRQLVERRSEIGVADLPHPPARLGVGAPFAGALLGRMDPDVRDELVEVAEPADVAISAISVAQIAAPTPGIVCSRRTSSPSRSGARWTSASVIGGSGGRTGR
jgi:hypothetical protein